MSEKLDPFRIPVYESSRRSFSTLICVGDPADVPLYLQAARQVRGVTVEVLPSEREDGISAVALYRRLAIELNERARARHVFGDYNPNKYAKAAQKTLEEGGSIVRLGYERIIPESSRSLDAFWHEVDRLKQASEPIRSDTF